MYRAMASSNQSTKSTRNQIPILARHAVSLSLVFTIALVLSYFVGHFVYQQIQLSKLNSLDQATFEQGVGYVVTHAGTSETVTADALDAVSTIDAQRAADLLLAIAQSHANREDIDEPAIPDGVKDAIAPLMHRLEPTQAIGLYDGLIQVKGIDPITTAKHLLNSLTLNDDAELLAVVDLLDARLLWSKAWAPLELWVRWLGVLATSQSELTQAQTAKRLGELPKAVDDPRISEALSVLSQSGYDTVRNVVLNAAAGYGAIAADPTNYEQIIFKLGQDTNPTIARRAWMIVGHLKPFSGFAVNWQDADPFIAEAMLWAAVKTNPESPTSAIAATISSKLQRQGLLALHEANGLTLLELQTNRKAGDLIGQSDFDQPDFVAAWRAILALQPDAGFQDYWYEHLELGRKTVISPIWDKTHRQAYKQGVLNRYLATTYRYNEVFRHEDIEWNRVEQALADLAAIEGRIFANSNANHLTPPHSIYAELVAGAAGIYSADLDALIGQLPLDQPGLLDLFTLALTHAEPEVLSRFIRSTHSQMVPMAALASAMNGTQLQLVTGVHANFLRKHPDLTDEQIRAMTDAELSDLGLSRIDALPALLDAASSAPPSANRSAETKLLKLALWMRGDLGDDFTSAAEAMLFDDELPTSTVLMCLLHMKRPVALDYLFGDLVTPRPDLHKLLIQERYWHVFRRFIDTSELTLWLWGDPEAQAFQLEAMKQWYAANRWKIEARWWPMPNDQKE